MRLEGQHQAAARKRAARRCDDCSHFHRVVAVVVDQRVVAACAAQLTVALKAAADTGEVLQRTCGGGVRSFQLARHHNRGQRVAHVVLTRQVQRHRQVGIAGLLRDEGHAATFQGFHLQGAQIGAVVQTVSRDRALQLRQDGLYTSIVAAQHGAAVEGQAVDEVHEGAAQPVQVVAIGLHVVGVDVGDDADHGAQDQEARITFVGFDNDGVALPQARIGSGAHQLATDHEGGVQAALGQHARHQRGGGRLAMRAGDGHALLQAHQLGQQHGTRDHGHTCGAGGQHFGVVGLDGGAGHNRLGADDVRSVVADEDGEAEFGQAPRDRAVALVRTGHAVAQVVQDLGNGAHAGAADADEMDVLDRVFHARTSFCNSSATRAAAWGLARARDFCAMASRDARVSPSSASARVCGVSWSCGK